MTTQTIIALDIGTSKLAALALDAATGVPQAVRTLPNDTTLSDRPEDWHEQDPIGILERCARLVRAVAGEADGPISALALTGQMHGVLLAAPDRRPLTGLITWRDGRTAADIAAWQAALGAGAAERTGCRLSAGYGGATLAWLAAREGIPAGALALTIADYAAAWLTGVAATEPTHAASWSLLDLRRGAWDVAVVAALGIPLACLPAVHPSARPLGTLRPERARELGLPPGIPVCAPVGDNQASFVGAAGLTGDAAVLNLGTGGQISVPTAEYQYYPHLETRPLPFGGYLLVGASLCGGWAYSYLRGFLQEVVRAFTGREMDDVAVYAVMNSLAAQTPAGSAGLRADTRFAGTRLDPAVRGGLDGIDTRNLTPAHLTRAVLEGMVDELASAADTSGVREIVACGNAVRKNPVLPAIIERRFRRPCRIGQHAEEAALGAALCARAALAADGGWAAGPAESNARSMHGRDHHPQRHGEHVAPQSGAFAVV